MKESIQRFFIHKGQPQAEQNGLVSQGETHPPLIRTTLTRSSRLSPGLTAAAPKKRGKDPIFNKARTRARKTNTPPLPLPGRSASPPPAFRHGAASTGAASSLSSRPPARSTSLVALNLSPRGPLAKQTRQMSLDGYFTSRGRSTHPPAGTGLPVLPDPQRASSPLRSRSPPHVVEAEPPTRHLDADRPPPTPPPSRPLARFRSGGPEAETPPRAAGPQDATATPPRAQPVSPFQLRTQARGERVVSPRGSRLGPPSPQFVSPRRSGATSLGSPRPASSRGAPTRTSARASSSRNAAAAKGGGKRRTATQLFSPNFHTIGRYFRPVRRDASSSRVPSPRISPARRESPAGAAAAASGASLPGLPSASPPTFPSGFSLRSPARDAARRRSPSNDAGFSPRSSTSSARGGTARSPAGASLSQTAPTARAHGLASMLPPMSPRSSPRSSSARASRDAPAARTLWRKSRPPSASAAQQAHSSGDPALARSTSPQALRSKTLVPFSEAGRPPASPAGPPSPARPVMLSSLTSLAGHTTALATRSSPSAVRVPGTLSPALPLPPRVHGAAHSAPPRPGHGHSHSHSHRHAPKAASQLLSESQSPSPSPSPVLYRPGGMRAPSGPETESPRPGAAGEEEDSDHMDIEPPATQTQVHAAQSQPVDLDAEVRMDASQLPSSPPDADTVASTPTPTPTPTPAPESAPSTAGASSSPPGSARSAWDDDAMAIESPEPPAEPASTRHKRPETTSTAGGAKTRRPPSRHTRAERARSRSPSPTAMLTRRVSNMSLANAGVSPSSPAPAAAPSPPQTPQMSSSPPSASSASLTRPSTRRSVASTSPLHHTTLMSSAAHAPSPSPSSPSPAPAAPSPTPAHRTTATRQTLRAAPSRTASVRSTPPTPPLNVGKATALAPPTLSASPPYIPPHATARGKQPALTASASAAQPAPGARTPQVAASSPAGTSGSTGVRARSSYPSFITSSTNTTPRTPSPRRETPHAAAASYAYGTTPPPHYAGLTSPGQSPSPSTSSTKQPRRTPSPPRQAQAQAQAQAQVRAQAQAQAQQAQRSQQQQQAQSQDDDADDYYEDEIDPYVLISRLPPLSNFPPRATVLPPKPKSCKRASLILDLDETLCHCDTDYLPRYDTKFPIVFEGIRYIIYVRIRPHLVEFLEKVSQWFETVVFTASQQIYADKILDLLDPEHKYVQHRLFRNSCLNVEGNYLKDLRILGRDLARVAIIDNSPQAFGYQISNGIPIESYIDQQHDDELLKLLPFLKKLARAKDVRPLISQQFNIEALIPR